MLVLWCFFTENGAFGDLVDTVTVDLPWYMVHKFDAFTSNCGRLIHLMAIFYLWHFSTVVLLICEPVVRNSASFIYVRLCLYVCLEVEIDLSC